MTQNVLGYFFDNFSQLWDTTSNLQVIVFKIFLGLRSLGVIIQGMNFIQNFKLQVDRIV